MLTYVPWRVCGWGWRGEGGKERGGEERERCSLKKILIINKKKMEKKKVSTLHVTFYHFIIILSLFYFYASTSHICREKYYLSVLQGVYTLACYRAYACTEQLSKSGLWHTYMSRVQMYMSCSLCTSRFGLCQHQARLRKLSKWHDIVSFTFDSKQIQYTSLIYCIHLLYFHLTRLTYSSI